MCKISEYKTGVIMDSKFSKRLLTGIVMFCLGATLFLSNAPASAASSATAPLHGATSDISVVVKSNGIVPHNSVSQNSVSLNKVNSDDALHSASQSTGETALNGATLNRAPADTSVPYEEFEISVTAQKALQVKDIVLSTTNLFLDATSPKEIYINEGKVACTNIADLVTKLGHFTAGQTKTFSFILPIDTVKPAWKDGVRTPAGELSAIIKFAKDETPSVIEPSDANVVACKTLDPALTVTGSFDNQELPTVINYVVEVDPGTVYAADGISLPVNTVIESITGAMSGTLSAPVVEANGTKILYKYTYSLSNATKTSTTPVTITNTVNVIFTRDTDVTVTATNTLQTPAMGEYFKVSLISATDTNATPAELSGAVFTLKTANSTIGSWTTNSAQKPIFLSAVGTVPVVSPTNTITIPKGASYILEETRTPNGFKKNTVVYKFNVTAAGQVVFESSYGNAGVTTTAPYVVTVKNTPFELRFLLREYINKATTIAVPGVRVSVANKTDLDFVDTFTTDDESVDISDYVQDGETYRIYISPDDVPEHYSRIAAYYDVKISSGQISSIGKGTLYFSGVASDGLTAAKFGSTQNTNNGLLMYIQPTAVYISKKIANTSTELSGAKLGLYYNDSDMRDEDELKQVQFEWLSTSAPQMFLLTDSYDDIDREEITYADGTKATIPLLPAGDEDEPIKYKLVESSAPTGYNVASTIPFTVAEVESDTLGYVGKFMTTAGVSTDKKTLTMYDATTNGITPGNCTIYVDTRDVANESKLSGAKMRLVDLGTSSSSTTGSTVTEWTSSTTPHSVSSLLNGHYYQLTQIADPSGYTPVSSKMTFYVTGPEVGKTGTTTATNLTYVRASGIASTLTPGKVTAYENSSTNNMVVFYDTTVEGNAAALAPTVTPSDESTLPKTGGFDIAMMILIASILMMGTGAVLVISDVRRRRKIARRPW